MSAVPSTICLANGSRTARVYRRRPRSISLCPGIRPQHRPIQASLRSDPGLITWSSPRCHGAGAAPFEPRRRPRRSSSVEPRSAAVASAPQPLRTPVTINSIARVTARSFPCSFQLASGAHQGTRTRALALTGMSVWNSYRVDAWPERHSSALCCERGAVRYLVGAGGDRGLTVMPRFASSSMTIFAFGLPASASFLVSDASVSSV
jgi:hypothetical protein